MNSISIIIKSMDIPSAPDPEVKSLMPRIAFFLSVIAIAGLGSIAKLLNDYKDVPEIQQKIWFAYLSSGLLSGLVLALILVESYGPSYFLIGLAGLAGFQSVQLLTWGALLLQSFVERVFKGGPKN